MATNDSSGVAPKQALTKEQADRIVLTGYFYVDIQISALDTEPYTIPCQSYDDCLRVLAKVDAGSVYRMWGTLWPANADLSSSPWYTNSVELFRADISLIAAAFASRWNNQTSRGVYYRG